MKAIADQAAATAIDDRVNFNDHRLEISLAAICDNSIGAVLRLQDDQVRDSLFVLCGGDRRALTMDGLTDLMRALSQMKNVGS